MRFFYLASILIILISSFVFNITGTAFLICVKAIFVKWVMYGDSLDNILVKNNAQYSGGWGGGHMCCDPPPLFWLGTFLCSFNHCKEKFDDILLTSQMN